MNPAELDIRISRLAAAAALYDLPMPWTLLDRQIAARAGARALALCALPQEELLQICASIFAEDWDER